jgi:hypothetical protein
MSFFAELRRRDVIRMAGLYLVGAWLVEQVAASLSNVWHSSLWSPRGKSACTTPDFPEFARKVGYAELWDQYGPPDLCRKDANGDYRCE